MIKIITLTLSLFIIAMFTGYYETRWAEDNRLIFFIKRTPTFQMTFVNIFDSDADDKPLNELDEEQRKQVIDYCKYRLGIETTLKTQAELEACKAR